MVGKRMKKFISIAVAVCMALTVLGGWGLLSGSALLDEPVWAAEKAPAKPVLKSVKAGYCALTVKWEPVAKADGYEIYYKKGDEKRKLAIGGETGKLLLTGLERGTKYTVKVRSFKLNMEGKKLRSKYSKSKTCKTNYTDWDALKEKYRDKEKVKELAFVKYKGNSKATFVLFKKDENSEWNKVLSCKAYVGQNGIDKVKEGDRKTPTGSFKLTCAFGIKDDPGSAMKYTKVNKYLWWCGDKEYYNTMIDIREKPHDCRGEHLINYTKQYAYSMNIGYNTRGEYLKGSAIFLHCFGYYNYTLGCVAVSEENMKTILQTCEKNSRICIYWK